jgi:hypothetical protein
LDVCLHLLKEGPVREVNFSTKIWEYLAVGKPLVCSWIPSLAEYDALVYRSRDVSHFLDNLMAAARERDPTKRAERARQAQNNTWERRAEDLFALLDQSPGACVHT